MACVIWKQPGNPPQSVSKALGIERWQLRKAIHKIKGVWNLSGTDRVTIYDDGSVTDENDVPLGNIHDEI
jgi:hypothetical protein